MSIHPFLQNYPTEGGKYPLPYFANPNYLLTEHGQVPMALFQPGCAPVQYNGEVDPRIQSAVAYVVSDFINTVMLKSNNNTTYGLLYAMLRYNNWNNNTVKLLLDIFFRNINNAVHRNPNLSVVEVQARTRRYVDTFLDAARAFTYWYYVNNSGAATGVNAAEHQEMIDVLEEWNKKEMDAYGKVTFPSQKQQVQQTVYPTGTTNQYNTGGYYDNINQQQDGFNNPNLAYNPYGVNNNGFVTDSATKPVGDPVKVRYPDPVPEEVNYNEPNDEGFVGFIPAGTFTPSRRVDAEPPREPVVTQQYPSSTPVAQPPVESSYEPETGISNDSEYNRWTTVDETLSNPEQPTIRTAHNPRTHRRRVLRNRDTGFTKEDFIPMDYNQHAIESVQDLAVVEAKRQEMSKVLEHEVTAEAARQEITRLAPTDKPFKSVVTEDKAIPEVFHDSANYFSVLNLRNTRFEEEKVPDVFIADAVATSSYCFGISSKEVVANMVDELRSADTMEKVVKAMIRNASMAPTTFWSALEVTLTSMINTMINQRTGLKEVYIESVCIDWYDLKELLAKEFNEEFVAKFSKECHRRALQLMVFPEVGQAGFETALDDLAYRFGIDAEEEIEDLRNRTVVYQQLQTVAMLNIDSSDLPVDVISSYDSVALGITETAKYVELYHQMKERNPAAPVILVTNDMKVFEMSTSLHDDTSVLLARMVTGREWEMARYMQELARKRAEAIASLTPVYPTE